MKIRTNFVSNSSSTSFILFAPKTIVEKLLSTFSQDEQYFLRYRFFNFKETKIKDETFLVFHDTYCSDDCHTEYYIGEQPADEDDYDYKRESEAIDVVHKFFNKAKQEKDCYAATNYC